MNRALMAAGPVDRVQVTFFPVISSQSGLEPIFQREADFDLELIESRTLDGNIQELIYRPTLQSESVCAPHSSSSPRRTRASSSVLDPAYAYDRVHFCTIELWPEQRSASRG